MGAPKAIPFKGTTTFKDLGANQLLATNVQTPTLYSAGSPLTYSSISSPVVSGFSSPVVSSFSSPVISGISGYSGIAGISGYFPTTYTGITGIKTNAIVPKVAAVTAGSSAIVYSCTERRDILWIITRDRNPDQDLIAEVEQKVKDNPIFDFDRLTRTNQAGCTNG